MFLIHKDFLTYKSEHGQNDRHGHFTVKTLLLTALTANVIQNQTDRALVLTQIFLCSIYMLILFSMYEG